MRPFPRTVLLVAVPLALVACGGGNADDITRIEADLDTQARAQTTLRERVIELEEQLAAAAAPDVDPATAELSSRVEDLQAQVDELTRQLEEASTSREDEQAEVLASLSSLESSLSELRARLDEFETEQQRLHEDLSLLERRFENHGH
jgi:chromosome segregation ATPase